MKNLIMKILKYLIGLFVKIDIKVKINIIVGHTEKSQGAKLVTTGESEYDYNKDLAKRIKKFAESKNVKVNIFYRDDIGISGVYEKIKKSKNDCALELHFNSFNKTAKGTTLLFNDEKDTENGEKQLAEKLQKMMDEIFSYDNRTKRKMRKIDIGNRGYKNVTRIFDIPSIILEPAFGSNPYEAMLLDQNKQEYAEGIINTVIAWKSV